MKFTRLNRALVAIPVLASLMVKPQLAMAKAVVPTESTTQYTSAQVSSFINTALRITHKPQSWSKPLYWIAWQESKFYARAVDGKPAKKADLKGDSEHAEGLMQVLPTTFRQFALRGMNNIWNPVDNVVASIDYVTWRYKSPYKIPGIFRTSMYRGY